MPLAGKVSDAPVNGIQRLTQLKTGPVYGLAETGLSYHAPPAERERTLFNIARIDVMCSVTHSADASAETRLSGGSAAGRDMQLPASCPCVNQEPHTLSSL